VQTLLWCISFLIVWGIFVLEDGCFQQQCKAPMYKHISSKNTPHNITGVFTLHNTHITGIVTPHDIAITDVVTPHDILQVLLRIIMVLIKQYIKFSDGMREQFLFC